MNQTAVLFAILVPLLGAGLLALVTSPQAKWWLGVTLTAIPVLILSALTFGGAIAVTSVPEMSPALRRVLVIGSPAVAIALAMAVVFLVLALTSPRGASAGRTGSARLLMQGLALASLFARDLRLFFVLWALIPAPLWWRSQRTSNAPPRRRCGYLLFQYGAFTSLLLTLVYLMILRGHGNTAGTFDLPSLLVTTNEGRVDLVWLGALVTLAGCLRQGFFPFQSGILALSEWAPLELLTSLFVTQSGLVIIFRVGAPLMGAGLFSHHSGLLLMGCLGLGYLAMLALARSETRRLFVVLATSDALLILLGLTSGNDLAAIGQRVHWISSILVVGGLGVTFAALERRVGILSPTERGGVAKTLPFLGGFALAFGLGAIHFPASLGFVSQEMLAHAFFERSPWFAVYVLVSMLMLAVALVRYYFAEFLGPQKLSFPVPDLRGRERVGLVMLLFVLIGLGLFPRVIMSRLGNERSANWTNPAYWEHDGVRSEVVDE